MSDDIIKRLRRDLELGSTASGRVFSASPDNIAAILDELDRLRAENEALRDAGVGYSQQTVDALTSERDRLRSALLSARAFIHGDRESHAQCATYPDGRMPDEDRTILADYDGLLDRLDKAERENERLREDAERYRFIRDADRSGPFLPIGSLLCYAMESLDAAIDAAMSKGKA